MYTLRTIPMSGEVEGLAVPELKAMLATLNAMAMIPTVAKLRALVVRTLAERMR